MSPVFHNMFITRYYFTFVRVANVVSPESRVVVTNFWKSYIYYDNNIATEETDPVPNDVIKR